jgi:hypothetical protein
MAEIRAKAVIEGKFWIIEDGTNKVGTLKKDNTNRFVLSNVNGKTEYYDFDSVKHKFGPNFFVSPAKPTSVTINEVQGFPTSCYPFNSMFDIKNKLPLFTKKEASKSMFCAGYYTIKFEKGWVKSFCPKLITIQRYEYLGPFKTEIEARQVLSNAKR